MTDREVSEPDTAAARLVDLGRRFDARGWVFGTSGNFSAVIRQDPVTLLITPSGAHKGRLSPAALLHVTAGQSMPDGATSRPSAETALHLAIAGERAAGAVLHTHSLWGTILSDLFASRGGVALEGYEMLKGLSGVTSHTHREWVPIFDNDQDIARLAGQVTALVRRDAGVHGFLIRGHGLYTWGASIDEAERHVEVLEFLFEVVGRGRHDGDRHDS